MCLTKMLGIRCCDSGHKGQERGQQSEVSASARVAVAAAAVTAAAASLAKSSAQRWEGLRIGA